MYGVLNGLLWDASPLGRWCVGALYGIIVGCNRRWKRLLPDGFIDGGLIGFLVFAIVGKNLKMARLRALLHILRARG